MKKQKIFITGGAGFLGINLIRFLLKKSYTIVSYDIADFNYPERNQITVITGDIRNKKLVERSMRGCNMVIHCAAALPLYSKEDIYSTDILGTRYVYQAAEKNQIKRAVFISSTAVYGIPDHHPLYENDKLIGVGPYGLAKILAEKEALRFRRIGMCVPIIRPKSFIGPERLGVFALFFDWAKDKKNFPMIGSGKNRYQLLDVEDLCQAIWLCMIEAKSKVNNTFNIGAEKFTSMREDYQAVLDCAGYGKKIISFPAGPTILILKILEFFKLSPLYKWVYETASKDSFVSIEKAKKILGFKPKYSNQQALIRNYKWYLKNIHQFENQSGISHRVPWKQGIFKLIKNFF